MTKTPLAIAAAAALALTASVALTDAAEARDQIRIVGSSTVFPFATAVAATITMIAIFLINIWSLGRVADLSPENI